MQDGLGTLLHLLDSCFERVLEKGTPKKTGSSQSPLQKETELLWPGG